MLCIHLFRQYLVKSLRNTPDSLCKICVTLSRLRRCLYNVHNRIKFKCCSTPRHIRFHDTFSNLWYGSFQNEFIRLSNKYFSLCLDFHRMTFYFGVIHFCSSALSLEYNCSICFRITQQVLTFPSNCSNCNSPVETRMKVVGILYEYRACFILITA